MRTLRCFGVSLAAMPVLLGLASSASATFPGRNGPLALSVNHIPYVIGIARVAPGGTAVNVESRRVEFYFGCQVNTNSMPFTCPDGSPSPSNAGRPSFSADGRELVYATDGHLEVVGTNGQGRRSLGKLTQADSDPAWFPSGRQLVFTGKQPGDGSKTELYTVRAHGTGLRRLIANGDDADVAPHGRLIAFDRSGSRNTRDLWVMNSNGSHPRLLVRGGSNPCFSPTGTLITFNSQNKLQRIDLGGRHRRTIVANGSHPSWSPDGKQIAFVVNDPRAHDWSSLYVVPAAGGKPAKLARDNPISEDEPEFDWIDWAPRVR